MLHFAWKHADLGCHYQLSGQPASCSCSLQLQHKSHQHMAAPLLPAPDVILSLGSLSCLHLAAFIGNRMGAMYLASLPMNDCRSEQSPSNDGTFLQRSKRLGTPSHCMAEVSTLHLACLASAETLSDPLLGTAATDSVQAHHRGVVDILPGKLPMQAQLHLVYRVYPGPGLVCSIACQASRFHLMPKHFVRA